jgi:hypothetical protein
MLDKYSISIWKDIPKVYPGTSYTYIGEEKVATIGSNTMTSLNRALQPQLINNINGTNTFSFLLYYTYINPKTGKKEKNPFIDLISNETKIKVFWKNKWYDFLVKNIQETSNGKSIQYTCTDLYINELSKTGFNLEFDAELNNNQGTVQELAKTILDGTEWNLVDNSQIIQQKIEEPVYELSGVEVPIGFQAKDEKHQNIGIAAGAKILLYYSVLRDKNTYLQFFYDEDQTYVRESSDLLTEDGQCLYIKDVVWNDTEEDGFINCYSGSIRILHISTTKNISTNYRAKRLVYAPLSKFDPLTGKYVTLYDYNGQEIYKYIDNEYLDPTVVQNLIINSENFSTIDGWIATDNASVPFFQLYPEFTSVDVQSESYLKIGQGYYYNSAFQTTTAALSEGFQPQEKYVFRFQAKTDNNGQPGSNLTSGISCWIGPFDDTTKKPNTSGASNYFTLSSFTTVTDGDDIWVECIATCNKAVTRLELITDDIGFFLNKNTSGNCWIKKVQFFPYVIGENANGESTRINPGDLDLQAVINKVYKYYNPAENTAVTDPENIKYLYVGTTDWTNSNLTPKYNENFEKIRSITEKNSNRFNLLQTLAETFECWVRFTVEHNNDGTIITEWDAENNKIIYHKYVEFKEDIGQYIGIGFKYGIDLQDIQRTINSEQIATKVIVSPNSNEYATNGFCTIARSEQNYSRENFILNFDYYISHGLLNGGELNKDLYLTTPDVIGYYYHLNQNNTQYDSITEQLTLKQNDLLKQDSFLTTYKEYVTSAQELQQDAYNNLLKYTGASNKNGIDSYIKKYPDDEYATELITKYNTYTNNVKVYSEQVEKLQTSVDKLNSIIENLTEQQETLVEANTELHNKFNQKYSRYIQEGSWISEDYIDDDLYYMDAVSVAYTSSRPQVTYNISVLRLSALEKFKNKIFNLGDISYIEDTEFFGYVNGTPYREQVLITEITSNFDEPAQDKITIQNYRTQFEDLFQRITATTQNLQYTQGGYQKAASAFTEDGNIKIETLQNSIAINEELIISAQNESIIQDRTGMTFTDLSNPNHKTKITSGGIFISTDGGATWKSAIRGEGISTQYLTTGSINTNYITILDGNHATFRWDSRGINAFSIQYDEENENAQLVNLAKFVRFDMYGIYGIDGNADFIPSADNGEQEIWDNALFGMTWRGFFVKNKGDNGWVEISSENDVAVFSGTSDSAIERIKIGRIGGDGSTSAPYVYGLRIRNANGAAVMETADNGTLWLRKELNISSTNDEYNIQIGYLDLKKEESLHRTIDVNNQFIVYEDGSMIASKGTFTGTIYATGGTIGGLTIEQVVGNGTRFEITSSEGLVVDREITSTILTAHAYRGEEDITDQYTYTWFVDDINKGTGVTYTLTIEQDITRVYFEATPKS